MDKNTSSFWKDVDATLECHAQYIPTDEQRQEIARAEQEAYERNVESLKEILEEWDKKLKAQGFQTKLQVDRKGAKFTYGKSGYYGPGGFCSLHHVKGPLVAAILDPKGDPRAFAWNNELDENLMLGRAFDRDRFLQFLQDNRKMLANQLTSKM